MDIFVFTADPTMEPPTLVVNTILSAMSYNYPPEKLSVYLSDDGGSEFTFYALLEASHFSKYWIPFCKKFNIEPRAPEAYFSQQYSSLQDGKFAQEHLAIKVSKIMCEPPSNKYVRRVYCIRILHHGGTHMLHKWMALIAHTDCR